MNKNSSILKAIHKKYNNIYSYKDFFVNHRTTIVLITIFLFSIVPTYGADVIFLDIPLRRSTTNIYINIACRFYGLESKFLTVSDSEINSSIYDALKQSDVQAIVIAARALPNIINSEKLLPFINRNNNVPILIMDINPQIDSNILSKISIGTINACLESPNVPANSSLKVNEINAITRQLTGQYLPYTNKKNFYFVHNDEMISQSIIEINIENSENLPVFIRTINDKQEIFFLTKFESSEFIKESNWKFSTDSFFQIAPILMFLRYSCGEKCWHTVGHYANLTIDDPWLKEPYGSLNYKKLLEEMNNANFHTTIAFIPWNYDRNESEVASIFNDYPNRFSICIHGNNHDHYEFYKYKTNHDDPSKAKPLAIQEANIKQAIARMEEFYKLTGISYDQVMIFPHNIAPSKTLGLLKKYNFLSTINSNNIPLGSDEPQYPMFRLRTMSLDFENFLNIKRSSYNLSKVNIAIKLFLDNPIFLYGHVYAYDNLFSDGIGAFNKYAEIVNNIQPDIKWQSVGFISKKLYIQKLINDGNYDVIAFCKSIILENTFQQEITYFIRKQESFSPQIKGLTVDGQPYPYERSGNDLTLILTIPPGKSSYIDIQYNNDLYITAIDISKNDIRVYLLRKLSDFRDNMLMSNIIGRTFIYYYYQKGFYKFGLKGLLGLFFLFIVFVTFISWYSYKLFKKTIFNLTYISIVGLIKWMIIDSST